MLVKSARRYINTLNKILKNQHNDIITEITEDDVMGICSVTLKFHIEGLYCFVDAFNNDDNVLYYVEGNGRAITYIISDNETQKESMYTILNRIYDIVVRLTTAHEESTEDCNEYEEISDRNKINFPTISEIYNDKCACCPADRAGNRCCGEKWCAETWKRYEAIIKPEWHHVSLETLANIDFDMLDKKRQVYLKVYRELKRTLSDLSKCKSCHAYEVRTRKFIRDVLPLYHGNEISFEMRKYLDLQISMSNVINGVWSSDVEPSTGLHESRRYGRPTLK